MPSVSGLQGKFDLVIFTSDGVVKRRVDLSCERATAVGIPCSEWHGVVFHAPAAVVLEVKTIIVWTVPGILGTMGGGGIPVGPITGTDLPAIAAPPEIRFFRDK
jgi:hypothetical protein